MSTFKKHVGRISNTDRRCVVVYMQIPGNEDNALIVDTDALPDRFHDALMTVVDSTEGQQVDELNTLLSRRVMPDMGVDMMNALHYYGQLRAVPIDQVVMFPAPNSPCPLRTIVDLINNQGKTEVKETVLENRVLENQKADASQGQIDIANNILQQAADLEAEAAKKREQAYRMAPVLRPREVPTTVLPDNATIADATSGPAGDCPDVTEASVIAAEASVVVVDAPHDAIELPAVAEEPTILDVHTDAPVETTKTSEAIEMLPESVVVDSIAVDADLPADVAAALQAAMQDFQQFVEPVDAEFEVQGNQVDTSDDAIQAFLDRVAKREDDANKELQESLKPKLPVGRPRKDGLPAGTKPAEVPAAPKKRGRPPKAKK